MACNLIGWDMLLIYNTNTTSMSAPTCTLPINLVTEEEQNWAGHKKYEGHVLLLALKM